MIKLNTDQMLYLLYADAYADENTVTKSTVKSYLPTTYKGESEKIYEFLRLGELIQQTSKGRFSVTEQGKQALLQNLSFTDYQFDSIKGPKVLNTLLRFIKQAIQSPSLEDMTFDEFREKFKSLYFEERKAKSLTGVAIVRKREISNQFINKYNLYPDLAFLIAPGCTELQRRKLKNKNIEFLETEKIIDQLPVVVEPQIVNINTVNINTADKELLIKVLRGTRIQQTTIDKIINNRTYSDLDDLESKIKNINKSMRAKFQAKIDNNEIGFC